MKYFNYALIVLFIVACGSNSSGVSTKLVQDTSQDNAKNCLVDAPKWFSGGFPCLLCGLGPAVL